MKNIIILSSLFVFLNYINGQKIQNRDSDPFNEVSVFGKIDVYLVKGEKPLIKLESDEIDLDNIKTRTDGLELRISLQENILSNTKKAKVTVTYVNLQEIESSGGSEVNVRDTLKSEKLELEASSGSSIYATVNCNDIEVEVSSGALVSLEGKTKIQNVSVGSGSTYSGYELECNDTYVDANSGGVAKISTIGILDANATTGATIIYESEPASKTIKKSLGGKIKRADE